MQQFLVKTPREIDYSIAAAFENDYFLFLGHFWAKLVAGVAANRWNVGHVLRCVRPRSSGCFKRFGFIYLSKLIYAGKLLHLFRKLFKKQIFSCIPLRRRFFVWQLGFMHLSILGVCPEDVYDLRFPFSPKFRKCRFDSTGLFGITVKGSLITAGKRPMSISLPLDLYYESNTYPWGPHRPCVVLSNQSNTHRHSQHFIAALGVSRQ